MQATFAHKCSLRLLRLYPRAWRERYADEAAAVLEERPATLLTLLDLFLGMLDAHLHSDLFTRKEFAMLQRLRNSQIIIFCSFTFFIILWALYDVSSMGSNNMWKLPYWYYTSQPCQNAALPSHCYPAGVSNYDLTFTIAHMAGLCALLAGLIGGIAFIRFALKQASEQKGKRFSRLFDLWRLSIVALVILTIALTHFIPFGYYYIYLPMAALQILYYFLFFHSMASIPSSFSGNLLLIDPLLIIWGLLFAWVVCIAPICLILEARKIEFPPDVIRQTFLPAALVTCAMLVVLAMMFLQVIDMDSHAHGATILYGPSSLLRVGAFNALVLCVALPTLLSCISLWRGFKAQRALALG